MQSEYPVLLRNNFSIILVSKFGQLLVLFSSFESQISNDKVILGSVSK